MGQTDAPRNHTLKTRNKEEDVRDSNIVAAKAICDAVRTSLGPRGMDKMIQSDKGEVVITNDGATILTKMKLYHPAAKMMQELSKAQDVEAGDGTTSVVVIAGSLLDSCRDLLAKGIHPSTIARSFQMATNHCERLLEDISIPVDLNDRESIIDAAKTSLSSKVISSDSDLLAPLAVDATLKVMEEFDTGANVDINENIRVVKQLGGTVDDTEIVEGLVLAKGKEVVANTVATGPKLIKNAKVGLIQFCISAPKTDVENNVVISEYAQMDRLLREERKYLLKICKKIKDTGCNVLLIQKSILRDATSDLSLHFLNKMKILVVQDVERSDIEFISKTVGCQPVAHLDAFTKDKLGEVDLVEQVNLGAESVIKITGTKTKSKTVSVLVRGSNRQVLEEADRSLHDAFCVVRCLVKKKFLIVGGGAPETHLSVELAKYADSIAGEEQFCIKAFAEALEVVPFTLAENAGLNAVKMVGQLRKKHREGKHHSGLNVRLGEIVEDLSKEKVLQPLLVTWSAISLASETVRMILKIDDMVASM
eukprot:maker-scaffold_2-snap-gene-8.34-mRNA-1 protein AED:0.02 eAED:0.02 QI:433/1/1/1/0.25/0.2/5/125/535